MVKRTNQGMALPYCGECDVSEEKRLHPRCIWNDSERPPQKPDLAYPRLDMRTAHRFWGISKTLRFCASLFSGQNKGPIPFGVEPSASDSRHASTALSQRFRCAFTIFASRVL